MNRIGIVFAACSAVLLGYLTVACAHSEGAAMPAVAGDAVKGQAIFERRCTGCHALDRNREGPMLAGVYGRTSGTLPNFPYSPELKRAHILWNDKSLEEWLAGPDTLVPGADMAFHVAKQEERQDVIAYLKTGPK